MTVVMPVYNEEQNIKSFIHQVEALAIADEIIAVDNNSTDNSRQQIESTSAIYVFEPKQGYGAALICGLRRCEGDLIFTIEPDGSFEAKDMLKMLQYIDEYDVVFGSRTNSQLIYEGAYMPHWIRIGNWVWAKFIELLYNTPSLTDVGCTLKLVRRNVLSQISSRLIVDGSHFSPEFMIRCIQTKSACIEIPISYHPRIGESKITGGNVPRTIILAIRMLFIILSLRVGQKSIFPKEST